MYPSSAGGFTSLLKKINIAGILDGTSKTLSVINQAIPIIYQVKPLIGGARSLFKITNIMNSNDASENDSNVGTPSNTDKVDNSSPVFFV